jgi:integrase
VAIPPHILPDLAHHLQRYCEPGRDGLLFVGPKGGQVTRSNFNRSIWKAAKAEAGLPERAVFHDLRGFSATIAARHGATVRELQHRLGHASAAMAMRYQRAEADRDATLAAAMSQGRNNDQDRLRIEAT